MTAEEIYELADLLEGVQPDKNGYCWYLSGDRIDEIDKCCNLLTDETEKICEVLREYARIKQKFPLIS